ncbi:hypothetical protein U8C45_00115 (plasmid) [Sinorhizobium meliloti]|nr:hypothetical protein U8C45_00115 [Sinorhizobium meliloti]
MRAGASCQKVSRRRTGNGREDEKAWDRNRRRSQIP